MSKMTFSIGTDIGTAIDRAVDEAIATGRDVVMEFNGSTLTVAPGDHGEAVRRRWQDEMDRQSRAYRESPEGRAWAARREGEISAKRGRIDALLARLPDVVGDQSALMDWLAAFARDADDVAVAFDKVDLALQLGRAGYHRNDCVGMEPRLLRALPDYMARYVVGQAIDCLMNDMPPHPIVGKFVAEYREIDPGAGRDS